MSNSSYSCVNCGAETFSYTVICSSCIQHFAIPPEQTSSLFLLQQRYLVCGQIVHASSGRVYHAYDLQRDQALVAIKEVSFYKPSFYESTFPVDSVGFQHYVELLVPLRHAHIPGFYACFQEDERWFLVMEYIEGQTLAHYVQSLTQQKVPVGTVLEIGLQICDALAYLHAQPVPVFYRVMKPSNIVRTQTGHLYLLDFGVSRYFRPERLRDVVTRGSPGYAAPEQYGQGVTVPQTDIYSLGALLHQLLTGEDPALTPFFFSRLTRKEPAMICQPLLLRMLDPDPAQRPESAQIVMRELQALRSQLPATGA